MWIVRLALRRQYTFIVMALLILVMGGFTISKTPTDVFPAINIPVVTVIWSYNGFSPDDMAKRICTISERAATTTVSDIEHIESQSMPGISVIKFYFQPSAKVEVGVAQLTSIMQTLLRAFPLGTTPPLIIQSSASSVPILQLGLGGKGMSESQLYDAGVNFVRTQLATIQGAAIATPYGGKPRQIMVDLDIPALQSKGLSPMDVSNAITLQNLILPSGTEKIGTREYNVFLNGSPDAVEALNNLPIKAVNGNMVYIRDVAHVHDGFAVQGNIVRSNGSRSSLLTVLKSGDASTLSVVDRVKKALPKLMTTLPPNMTVTPLFDQSIFVRSAVEGVVREAAIAACLTAAMILVFLGSWRSTLIVAVSIPLAILTSIVCLGFLGQTMNTMTLGGLALAVGILVDDATVTIENIHLNISQGKSLTKAILDGAQQIAAPTFVATISICIVFVSVVFLTGPAKFLFTPLAMAVVFAMLASYLLSRTLVPVMVKLMLGKEMEMYMDDHGHGASNIKDPFYRFHQAFNLRFDWFRSRYVALLSSCLQNRGRTLLLFSLLFLSGAILIPLVGQDFFPSVDAGQFRLHVRAPAGTRIEETARLFENVEETIRQTIPARELNMTLDNIGLPVGGINLAYSDSATIGSADGEILVQLKEGHGSTPEYVAKLRRIFRHKYPDLTFFFQPADIVNQILNYGLPAPIDVQVVGRSPKNYDVAVAIANDVRKIPGAVDVHVHQVLDTPSINVTVDRDRAQDVGLAERDVANNLLVSLSSSGQASPNFWLDPKNGVSYPIAVQTPQYKMDSIGALQDTPINSANGAAAPQLLSNLATLSRGKSNQLINHYNVQTVFDVYANVQNRDLGSVARDINRVLAKYEAHLPRGSSLAVRGQVQSMNESFVGLGTGIVFAILLVYLLLVVNFQSWVDPFIIIMALPGALSGILWTLFGTHTTFSVPSLMGTIMCIGVATANSILIVTFANDRRQEGASATEAALAAGYTRLRPVLMTALAMIVGMLPMALGLGEGGEQNAPLGRAVIGGLAIATFTTLLFVPVVYSRLRSKQEKPMSEEDIALLAEPTPA
ncbi:MAG: efflux RND transporter permease subunit [Fimbriimonas sp.]|nr:efflux RND transporter permease subunit [Fimbriimonas sp.]